MKKFYSNNEALKELLVKNGINLICNEDMDIIISDEDAAKIPSLVNELAPAAYQDYSIGGRIMNTDTDEQLIDELMQRGFPDIRELQKENSALRNKIAEIIHYVREMTDYAKDERSGAVTCLIRWIYCLTDKQYRKKHGERTKKQLWKQYGIKG